MKRRWLVEIEVEAPPGALASKEEFATWVESILGEGAIRVGDVTVWPTTEDYLADLEDGYAAPIGGLDGRV